MSVLKSLDIDLPRSERRSLYRFLGLYLILSLVVLVLTASLYYTLQKELAAKEQTILLEEYTQNFLLQLEELQNDTTNTLLYPREKGFETSLYGSDYKLIYSTLEAPRSDLTEVKYTNSKIIRYITQPHKYYLNTQYIVVQSVTNDAWLDDALEKITLFGLVFLSFMLLLGYFLVKLFLKPMRDALVLLDTFIKDTTHELNTPVSTIMTNIELINKENLGDSKHLKIINRIDIGAKTISNIYDDLTYLMLKHKIISQNENINVNLLTEQRLEYFATLIQMKKITLTVEQKSEIVLFVDRKKLSKLIDNILSNAIKYNRVGGTIFVSLSANSLTIEDSGRGIRQEHIEQMFERYTRFDKSVGGFGIGLNIVKMICDEYGFSIKIESEFTKQTKVTIAF